MSVSELSESELSESDEDDSASSIARRCSMMIRGAFWATDGMMSADFEAFNVAAYMVLMW